MKVSKFLYPFFCSLLLSGLTYAQSRHTEVSFFEGSFSSMKKEAEHVGKPFFIYFYSYGCYPCTKMDSISFKDSEVVSYINQTFFPCKSDGLFLGAGGIELAQRLNVTRFPTIILFDRSATPIYAIEGYIEPTHFIGNLKQEYANLSTPGFCPSTAKHYDPSEHTPYLPENLVIYPPGFKFDVPVPNDLTYSKEALVSKSNNVNRENEDMVYINKDEKWFGDMAYASRLPIPIVQRGTPAPNKVPVGNGLAKAGVNAPKITTENPSPAKTISVKSTTIPKKEINYAVQLGAYDNLDWANAQLNSLKDKTNEPIKVVSFQRDGKIIYKILAGKSTDRKIAEGKVGELKKIVADCFITTL